MKKILFPTDFSEIAENAFVFALELANVLNAELLLLHSYEIPIVDSQFMPVNNAELYTSLELGELENFKQIVPKLREIAAKRNLENIQLSHKLVMGDLNYNINTTIAEDLIDFVVMGTSGGNDWFSRLVGTNADSAISSVKVPLLVVPEKAVYSNIDTIAFTTRFRDKDKLALQKTIAIANTINASVKCLYVQTSGSDVATTTIDQWREEFKNQPVQFIVVPSEKELVEETILGFLSHQGIDLLSMVTYKRGFFEQLFSSSMTKNLSHHSNLPLLVLQEQGK